MQDVAAIRLSGVAVRFGTYTAVQDVDIAVRAEEFGELVGPTGCAPRMLSPASIRRRARRRSISGGPTPTGSWTPRRGRDWRATVPLAILPRLRADYAAWD
jgi:hypothetical protein